MSRYSVSFQLYSARFFLPVEPQLAYLKEVGYDAVELWPPNYEEDAKTFRRQVDAAGLEVSGMHMPLAGLVAEPRRYFDYAHEVGTKTLIPPYVPQAERVPTADFWRSVGDRLRVGAELAKAEGLKVAWHNHDFEYVRLEDYSRPIDHIMDAAGPDVEFEIDIGWVTRGWADPAKELTRYADRITAIQLKDTALAGTDFDQGWTPTGDGIIDWPSLRPLFDGTRANLLVVEHDRPSDWKALAKRSVDYIKALVG
ncbi:sugar phosphate isomerase [Devosia riboflavina]|uniref:Sugar phosphate isomerase n=1 Tax=Devosia riboflavina TaxID=46914 RepID=A0A087M3D2_9HYPH|nr:sugar phosphate isomerase/epimerase [Devosia riboflavina]KFL31385.1 sugar phosphate isomerase [Devosia riboflavina]